MTFRNFRRAFFSLSPMSRRVGAMRRGSLAAFACCVVLLAGCEAGTRSGQQAPVGTATTAQIKAPNLSGGDSSANLQKRVDEALKGKTIAWVPIALGIPLADIWTQVMRAEAEARGMKLEVRDPNWNTTAALQAVSSLIAERPDILVVHNPNVQLYAQELARANA